MCSIKYHPLCGVPPLIAASGAATQGLHIQKNSSTFFKNNSFPGGILTAPGEIKEATAKRLKEYWSTAFSGENAGKIAVLGDGLSFEPLGLAAENSQLAEQAGLSAQTIAARLACQRTWSALVRPRATTTSKHSISSTIAKRCNGTLRPSS